MEEKARPKLRCDAAVHAVDATMLPARTICDGAGPEAPATNTALRNIDPRVAFEALENYDLCGV